MSGMRSAYTNVYSDYKYEWYEVYLHEWYEVYLHKCLLITL
jgi:hypothetical protein